LASMGSFTPLSASMMGGPSVTSVGAIFNTAAENAAVFALGSLALAGLNGNDGRTPSASLSAANRWGSKHEVGESDEEYDDYDDGDGDSVDGGSDDESGQSPAF